MFYFTFIIIVCCIFLMKKIDSFFQYDRRLLIVIFFLSINLFLGLLYNYLSSTEFFKISILLSLFNGPLFYYVLFDKSKYLVYLQYFMMVLVFVYIIGYSYFIDKDVSEIILFNCYSTFVCGTIGLMYMIVCYCLLIYNSLCIKNEIIIIFFIVIVSFESSMLFTNIIDNSIEISSLTVFIVNTAILVLSSIIYLFYKLFKNIFYEYAVNALDMDYEVIRQIESSIDKEIESKVVVDAILENSVANSEIKVDENDFLVISLVLNKKLIDNKLFLDPNLTLHTLSDASNISKTRLTSFFKSSVASNFKKYINRIRIEYAVILLHEYNHEELNVEKWALLSGFNSRVTFYRSFIDVYGFPPSELLKD